MSAAPTYPCARCGKRWPAARMVYSKWTKHRYCRDRPGCDRRKTKRDHETKEG